MVFKKGYKQTEEHKRKIRNALKGVLKSEEAKENMSKGYQYHTNSGCFKSGDKGHLGFKHSEETKEKSRLKHIENWKIGKEKINDGCFKKGIEHKNYGKTWEELYGEKMAKEIKEKIIFKRKEKDNYKHTEETKEKLKEKRKNRIIPMNDTKIEVKIQNFLKLLHIEFLTHYYISEITHRYRCDIFIPSIKIIIEADGCYWHGCKLCNKNINKFQEEQIKEDEIRTKELQEKGYRVIRLWEHDIKKMELNDFQTGVFGKK